MIKMSSLAAVLVVLTIGSAVPVRADQPQSVSPARHGDPGRPRSFEVSFGGEFQTSQSLGTSTATLTSNAQPATPFTYFVVSGSRATAPGFRGHIGYNITPTFTVEGGVILSRGNVQGDISTDAENVLGLSVTEKLTQYVVDAAVLIHLRNMTFASGAGVPFLEAGGGYLRQVHEGNLAINTGQIYHFGGGVTYMFSQRPTSALTGLGIRIDGRVYVPRKGYSFGSSQNIFAGLGGSLVLAF